MVYLKVTSKTECWLYSFSRKGIRYWYIYIISKLKGYEVIDYEKEI